VDGHQDLPSDGHEADGMVITESNRILAIAPRDLLRTIPYCCEMSRNERRWHADFPVRRGAAGML
jgi:hypothetical protein